MKNLLLLIVIALLCEFSVWISALISGLFFIILHIKFGINKEEEEENLNEEKEALQKQELQEETQMTPEYINRDFFSASYNIFREENL